MIQIRDTKVIGLKSRFDGRFSVPWRIAWTGLLTTCIGMVLSVQAAEPDQQRTVRRAPANNSQSMIRHGGAEKRSPALLRAVFFAEPEAASGESLEVPPPSFEGKAMIKGPDGAWMNVARPAGIPRQGQAQGQPGKLSAGADIFIADGSENALAINVADGNNLLAVINLGFTTTPAMKTSADGNLTWTTRTFPNGGGTYTGFPFDPWANEGNTANELFATLIRRDTVSSNAHSVIARSTDSGVSWSLFFERTKNVFQDREMVDIDRTTALGGGTGTTHDGKVYLCYDDFGVGGAGYVGSFLQVVSPGGSALTELTISTAFNFRGSKLQPVAGTTDGKVFLMGLSTSGGGATRILQFHEVSNGGAALNINNSSFSFATTGQKLGATTRYGVNGHRINSHMAMDIDRTTGPRRGNLYVISNRNPNPSNAALDQGDVFLSVSTDGAFSWSSALVPGQASGKTQFFSMIDVDDNGWIHVAYVQNETGSVNGGVLNASTANVYYTLTKDGGVTWDSPFQVNDPGNVIDYFEPPPDLSAGNFYLIGDYFQIKATGTGVRAAGTKAYIHWTGYDKDRSNIFLGDKRERALVTTVTPTAPSAPPAPPAFSIDFQSPTMGALATGSLVPITEGDILYPAPGIPSPGPLPPPGIAIFGGVPSPGPDLGLAAYAAAVGHPGGIPGFVEVDALSFGTDPEVDPAIWPEFRWSFSVDEHAGGIPFGAPDVFSEGPAGGPAEASADIFVDFPPGGLIVPPFPACPPPPPFSNTHLFDGDGLAPPVLLALPLPPGPLGLGLIEPNPPTPGLVFDPGDNVDAIDLDTSLPTFPVFFSLDSAFPDPLEVLPANSGSALFAGLFVGGDVLVTAAPGGPPFVFASSFSLGLDIVAGPDSDDLDALVLHENGSGVYEVSSTLFDWVGGVTDMLLFSVRRGSAVIGFPDSLFGCPIEEGDILAPPVLGGVSPFPAIFIPAEMLGLATVRSTGPLPPPLFFPFGEELDALDVSPDCNVNGVPDFYDIAYGTEPDVNGNGVPDSCDLVALPAPLPASGYPDEAAKNRYISFVPDPSTAGTLHTYLITHVSGGTDCLPGPHCCGGDACYYISTPRTDGATPGSVAGLGLTYVVSDALGTLFDFGAEPIIHVGGCLIASGETYEVEATADGITFSAPLTVATAAIPTNGRFWADAVGVFSAGGDPSTTPPTPAGAWTPPDGIMNGLDITAALKGFLGIGAPDLTWTDVNDVNQDRLTNGLDILRFVNAFSLGSGKEFYPFPAPGACTAGSLMDIPPLSELAP